MNTITSLHQAKSKKQDEFYTQLKDIENELKHYEHHFKNKVVYCNCDDPQVSEFFKYFVKNFEILGLKKLTATCYKSRNFDLFSICDLTSAPFFEYDGDEIEFGNLKGDGDFRSDECIAILEEADVVVTNPPFSLFREYVNLMIEHKKKFLIVGNMNAITYKEIFPRIQKNEIWLGNNLGSMEFKVPNHYLPRKSRYWEDDVGQKWRSMGNTCWFTNLEHHKRNKKIILHKKYISEDYPLYDNYNAIEVGKTNDIPKDWNGVMGVPITFLDKYNPDQFEIVKFRKGDDDKDLTVNGKSPYFRILIKMKNV